MNILFLRSSSQSRQRLLNEAQIAYKVIGHNANEEFVSHGSFERVVAVAKSSI